MTDNPEQIEEPAGRRYSDEELGKMAQEAVPSILMDALYHREMVQVPIDDEHPLGLRLTSVGMIKLAQLAAALDNFDLEVAIAVALGQNADEAREVLTRLRADREKQQAKYKAQQPNFGGGIVG